MRRLAALLQILTIASAALAILAYTPQTMDTYTSSIWLSPSILFPYPQPGSPYTEYQLWSYNTIHTLPAIRLLTLISLIISLSSLFLLHSNTREKETERG